MVLPASETQELQGHGGFHPDFKGKSGRPGNMFQGQSSGRHFLREQCMNLREGSLSCNGRPQDVGDAKNSEHLPRKATSSEWNQPKKEVVKAAHGKAIGAGLPEPIGAHILVPCAPNARIYCLSR
jgi:hypothetical protein